MAGAAQTRHRTIRNPGHMAYVSFDNVTNADELAMEVGSENLLTSVDGVLRPRPGFGAIAIVAPGGGWPGNIHRIYTWRKWGATSASWIGMVSCISGSDVAVYKFENGVDATAVLIHTATGTTNAYDFVVSNDWCFFGNNTTAANMRKWTSGVAALAATTYKWGIDKPAAAPVISVNALTTTATPTASAGTNWTDPTFALADDSSYAVYNNTAQNYLRLTTLALAIPAGNSAVGIQVSIKANGTSATVADRQIQVGLTKDGTTLVGTLKTATLNQTTDTTSTLGGATDLWGSTFTEAELESATFGVLIRDADTTGAALNINYVTVTVSHSPATALSAAYGYKYRVCYGSSLTEHMSSPSSSSNCTGVFSDTSIGVTLVASADAQVDRIHVFRTTDSGSSDPIEMREITSSPFTNTNQTISDATADNSLSTITAPALNRNDPPPAASKLVYAQGRIWMASSASTWYTGDEEIQRGVAEECVPESTLGRFGGGNVVNWDTEVTGHASLNDGIAVVTPQRVWKVEGDSLDTFRRYKLLDRRGARSHTNIATLGGSVAWFDTAGQMWLDGQEIGLAIRPDLEVVDQSQSHVAVHLSGTYHHICLLDGARGKLYVYDLDTARWMPPWTIGTTATALFSGETVSGTIDLMIARNGSTVLKQTASTFLDSSSTYIPKLISSLSDIHAGGNPDWRGVVNHIELRTGSVEPSTVSVLIDDDPTVGAFTALTASAPQDRAQGSFLICKRYEDDGAGTRQGQQCAVKIVWAAENRDFALNYLDIAHREVGR